jgi:hypothetical protein
VDQGCLLPESLRVSLEELPRIFFVVRDPDEKANLAELLSFVEEFE